MVYGLNLGYSYVELRVGLNGPCGCLLPLDILWFCTTMNFITP